MALMHFARTVAWDATRTAPATNGINVLVYSSEVGGSPLQAYSAAGVPISIVTEGFTVPDFWLQDTNEAWLDAGAGRFQVEAVGWVRQALTDINNAVTTVGSFEARVAALEAAPTGGGSGGGGSQLGLVEDVFTIAADNGSSLIGANGATISRTAFTYTSVPDGHRLVIKDHPDYATSTTQPLLPAAFWGEAAKAQPQAEFVSLRTPVAG